MIGKGAVIGGNVWLTSSVPPGAKVFGRSREDEMPSSRLAVAKPSTPSEPDD